MEQSSQTTQHPCKCVSWNRDGIHKNLYTLLPSVHHSIVMINTLPATFTTWQDMVNPVYHCRCSMKEVPHSIAMHVVKWRRSRKSFEEKLAFTTLLSMHHHQLCVYIHVFVCMLACVFVCLRVCLVVVAFNHPSRSSGAWS